MDPKAARIQSIGVALYGQAGWQARLAAALDLSRQHVGAMVAGDRRVTDDVEQRIVRALDDIIPRLEATVAELRVHREAIAAELEPELEPAPEMTLR